MDTSVFFRDVYKLIFQHLPHNEVHTTGALVCKDWNRLAYEVLRALGLELLRTKVLIPGKYGTVDDFKLISWTIDSETITADILKKFIRGNATELSLLKVIQAAKANIVNDDVIIYALHGRRSSYVLKALACNNPEVTRRCILDALHYKNRPVLQAILDPETPKFGNFIPYSLTWMETRTDYFKALDILESINNPNESIKRQQIIKPSLQKFSCIHLYIKSLDWTDRINIEHLDLKGIKLKNIDEYIAIRDFFPYLKTLHVDDTLSKLSHKDIINLLCLEDLEICSTHLEEFTDFDNLIHLTRLSLKDSGKLKKISGDIKYLQKLSILDLSGCKSLIELPEEIQYLGNLEILDLRFTGLCILPNLTKNTSLKELRIDGCFFADVTNFTTSKMKLLDVNPNLKIVFEPS